jgi:uncharacterized SAM-binding protein YcdF (DUF218 family)
VIAALLERPLVVREPLRALDGIIVLGAPLVDNRLTSVLAERVAAAHALWLAGGAPRVIATGGVTDGASRSEASVLAEALAARGIPDVLVEDASLTTADNARLTAALVAPLGIRSVWIVTQPFHTRRAVRLFRRAGLDAHGWPAGDRRKLGWLVREYAAWAALLTTGPWRRARRRPGDRTERGPNP